MTTEDIFTRVSGLLSDQLGIDISEITMDSNFILDMNADSLDLVEMVMELEQEFDISIPDEDTDRIQTVGDAVKFIEENI